MFCTNHQGANSQWLNHGTVTTTTIWDLSEDEMFVWNPSFLDISFEHLLPVAIAPSNLALCLHQKVTRIFGWDCSVSSLDQMVSTTWPGLLQHATFRHVMFVCTSWTRPRDACKFMPRSAGYLLAWHYFESATLQVAGWSQVQSDEVGWARYPCSGAMSIKALFRCINFLV